MSEAAKPQIEFDTFAAVDMRVGQVMDVEEFPEARKPAWKLTVDFGPEIGRKRTSAQVTNYSKDELLDRLVIGVVNFGTKRIAEFDSEFLILGSMTEDGTVLLISPEENAELGEYVA